MDVRVQVSNVRLDDGISFGTQLLESLLLRILIATYRLRPVADGSGSSVLWILFR